MELEYYLLNIYIYNIKYIHKSKNYLKRTMKSFVYFKIIFMFKLQTLQKIKLSGDNIYK